MLSFWAFARHQTMIRITRLIFSLFFLRDVIVLDETIDADFGITWILVQYEKVIQQCKLNRYIRHKRIKVLRFSAKSYNYAVQ